MKKIAIASLLGAAALLTACGDGSYNTFGDRYVGTWQTPCTAGTTVTTRYQYANDATAWVDQTTRTYQYTNCTGTYTDVPLSGSAQYAGASFNLSDGSVADGALEFGQKQWLNLTQGLLCKGDPTSGINPDGYPAKLQPVAQCAYRIG